MRRLLVVDDEESVTTALVDYFTTLGYAVDVAANEAEAIAMIDQSEYEGVVTDLRLSGARHMGGMDVIAHLRGRGSAAACLVLTAYGDNVLEFEARARGADDFLQKPAALRVLAEHLARLLDRRVTRTRT
jgi:DNA-binding response OmpR family regulator